MAQSRKFGTFGGVFVPSILTILGVIMYLRLPWLVGQAGLWATIGIIVVAHVISVTTGLSVASIATDKKVKVGGIYYIISRSLGLPIGGTLGIALFVGLSFSVSLYIIGFIESLLPALGVESTIGNIRMYSTVAVLAVTGVITISTSLALKTQYFILGAIGLSLASIFLGSAESAPVSPHLDPLPGGESLMVLFGIFFPAVTGFTAGVQMSGDLKDPKRSIPIGTVASIGVGFIVYVGLTVFLAFRVSPDALVANSEILGEMAWLSPLVLAGIWGATLSSAMGSLLGAPRILQATSMDRITPKYFAKGFGPSNEPRNALILTVVIAEVGILIGDLNVIAAVISIFFITTYGFINLSCAIENWASPDFRPSFKVHTGVSVLGAASCFLVMIQLDILSFLAGSGLLGLLYAFLKRRELSLESGDTWEGVWSSIIRSGLHQLSQIVGHARNWRPNIILFSGGTGARPHLIEFGEWIVHKRGILSNFHLKETEDGEILFPKAAQSLHDVQETARGIFSRQLECRDIYEEMETISRVFGFSGIEPNTILMGWARNSRDPEKLGWLIRRFTALDYNVFMLDYDLERGFGDHKQIDLWWRGGSNNATLSLTVIKMLSASMEWQDAEIRILILVDDGALSNRAYSNMNQILTDQRISATVKVINNAVERLPFVQVIKAHSMAADLILLGLPVLQKGDASKYIDHVDSVVSDLGSTLLVHASSFFEPLYVGIDVAEGADADETGAQSPIEFALQPLVAPTQLAGDADQHIRLSHVLTRLDQSLNQALGNYAYGCMGSIAKATESLLVELSSIIQRYLRSLEDGLAGGLNQEVLAFFGRVQADLHVQFRRVFSELEQETIQFQGTELQTGVDELLGRMEALLVASPEAIQVTHAKKEWTRSEGDSASLRLFKWQKRVQRVFSRKPVVVRMPYGILAERHLKVHLPKAIFAQQQLLGIESHETLSELRKWLGTVRDALGNIEKQIDAQELTSEAVQLVAAGLTKRLEGIGQAQAKRLNNAAGVLLVRNRELMQEMCRETIRLDGRRRVRKSRQDLRGAESFVEAIAKVPGQWSRNMTLLAHYTQMEAHLMAVQHRIEVIAEKMLATFQLDLEGAILGEMEALGVALGQVGDERPDLDNTYDPSHKLDLENLISDLVAQVRAAVDSLPEKLEIIAEDSFLAIDELQYEEVETAWIAVRGLVADQMESDFLDPVTKDLEKFPEALQAAARAVENAKTLLQAPPDPSPPPSRDQRAALRKVRTQDGVDRLGGARQGLEASTRELTELVRGTLENASSHMNPYLISRSDSSVGVQVRRKGRGHFLLRYWTGRK